MGLSSTQKKKLLDGKAVLTPVSELGLSGRREVYIESSCCAVLIDRKSRFVRKDAQAFVEILDAAREHTGRPMDGTVLIRRAPVCSKAREMLNSLGVDVVVVS